MRKPKYDCVSTLQTLGITYADAESLRLISMTLHRWHELECGDGNNYGSWAIVRGAKIKLKDETERCHGWRFEHDDDGAAFLEHYHYLHVRREEYVTYLSLSDCERDVLKQLIVIIARYPELASYVQTDPR